MTSWIPELISAVIIAAFTFLFPYKPGKYESALSFSELKKSYQKWELFSIVPLFVFMPLLTMLFSEILKAQYQYEIDDNPRIIYQLLPETYMWLIPGMLMAFAVVAVPMILLYRYLLKDKYEEYTQYTNLKHGYDGMKAYRPIAWLCGIMALIAIYLTTDYYIKIWGFKVEVNDLMGTEVRDYNFNQIKKITYVEYARSGNAGNVINENPHYHVLFNDHYLWDTSKDLHNDKLEPEIMQFLSSRANVHIDTLGVDER